MFGVELVLIFTFMYLHKKTNDFLLLSFAMKNERFMKEKKRRVNSKNDRKSAKEMSIRKKENFFAE